MNAGAIPADHWTQDPAVGGGRIIGEACHFIDLLRFLTGAPIAQVEAAAMESAIGDSVGITLRFTDGSLGRSFIWPTAASPSPRSGWRCSPAGGCCLDNFRKLRGFGWPGFRKMNLWRQDKGQRACAKAFVDAVRGGGGAPIPLDEILEVSRVAIEVAESLR